MVSANCLHQLTVPEILDWTFTVSENLISRKQQLALNFSFEEIPPGTE